MKTPYRHMRPLVLRPMASACVLLSMLLGASAFSQTLAQAADNTATERVKGKSPTPEAVAIRHVNNAASVVRKMQSEPRIANLIRDAKGVFLMPNYVRAAVGVGGGGGPGVLLVRNEGGTWSDPAFFHVGSISVGVQVGVAAGPIALILNNEKAVNHFMKPSNFALSADTGLTIVNWTAMGTAGPGDATAWSGSKGLFGNVAAVSLSDIRFSLEQTSAYYRQPASVEDVIKGSVKNPQAEVLKQALATSAAKVLPKTGNETLAK